MGSCLSVVVFIFLMLYASYKITDLIEYKHFKLLRFEKENYYDMREPLTSN